MFLTITFNVFSFFVIMASFIAWLAGSTHMAWIANRRAKRMEDRMKEKDQQYADLLKKINDLEKSHPFSFMRRAN